MGTQHSSFSDLDLTTIELPDLYEMLTTYTIKYTRMMTEGTRNTEFIKHKEFILKLQSEINSRNGRTGQTLKTDLS